MRALILLVAFGCSNESDKPPPRPEGAAGRGTAAAAPTPPPVDAAPVVAPVDAPVDAAPVESKHGYCEFTFTGAINDSRRVAMEARWVASDYWLSAKTKAQNAEADREIKRQGYTFDESTQRPLKIFCQDAQRGYFLHFDPSKGTRLKMIKQKPQDLPIEYHLERDQKPGQIISEILTRLAPLYPSSGTLRITKFQQGELEATFELEAASIRNPPDKVKLVGKVVYHCADYDRCGAG